MEKNGGGVQISQPLMYFSFPGLASSGEFVTVTCEFWVKRIKTGSIIQLQGVGRGT
jgi:hypothetical protein